MKKILILMLAAVIGITAVEAQPTKKQLKAIKSEIASWQAEGWKAAPGDPTIAEQILKSKEYDDKKNEDDEPLYLIGTSTAVGETFKAAQLSAMRGVKKQAIEQLESDITSIIQEDLANKQQGLDNAVSPDKVLNRTMEVASKRLPRGIKIVSVYRELKTKTVEVRMSYAYNYDKVVEMIKATTSQALEDEIEEMVNGK